MGKYFSTSQYGITVNYKCYKLKKPFRKVCDKDSIEDCYRCEFCRAEMKAYDAVRLLEGLRKRVEDDSK